MMYLIGQGVEKDPAEAMRLFTLSAKQGDQYAQSNLGLMYSDGFDDFERTMKKHDIGLKKQLSKEMHMPRAVWVIYMTKD